MSDEALGLSIFYNFTKRQKNSCLFVLQSLLNKASTCLNFRIYQTKSSRPNL